MKKSIMKRNQFCFFSVITVAFVSQSSFAIFSDAKKDEIVNKIQSINSNKPINTLIGETLQKFSRDSNVEILSFVGKKANDFSFHAMQGKTNYVAKVVIDESSKLEICKKVLDDYDTLNYKITYLGSKIEKYREFAIGASPKFSYTCVLTYEQPDTDLSVKNVFSAETRESKAKNSQQLFLLFGEVIQAFAELKFTANVLHGDIKPDNIMVRFKQVGGSSEKNLEPAIVKFDFILKHKLGKEVTDKLLRYSWIYNPPELIRENLMKLEKNKKKNIFLTYTNHKDSKLTIPINNKKKVHLTAS